VRCLYEGWRPFIGLDGCHIRNGKPRVVLTAVARDLNAHMYPTAYVVVQSEHSESWTWFLENLLAAMGHLGDKVITFISDIQKVN